MPKIFQQESRVIALGEESNDMYISLDMIFLTSEVNLNKIEYSEDFIYGIENEKNKYIGLPLQCDVTNLEKGQFDKLTHKYNKKNKTFGTQSIGSFVDFKTQRNGDVLELVASARVWKRNPITCAALEELYASKDGLKFSYEVLVGNSTEENGIIKVPKDDSNNPIGSCVVSVPAVKASTAILLVAELSNQSTEGGENVLRNKDTYTVENMFENSKMTLIAELDISQVQRKIYNAMKTFIEDDWYDYEVHDYTINYVIVKKYCDGDFYKIDYSVGENDVQLSNMRKVTKKYEDIPNEGGELEMATIAELELKVTELETQIASLNTTITEKDTLVAEKDVVIATKETELVEKSTQLETLSASVIEKDKLIVELEPIKVEHETRLVEKAALELAEKKANLKGKYSKLLDEKVLAEVEIAEAIENLNEDVLKNKVVEIAMASATQEKPKAKEITIASRILDSVKISGDSDPTSLKAKYSI